MCKSLSQKNHRLISEPWIDQVMSSLCTPTPSEHNRTDGRLTWHADPTKNNAVHTHVIIEATISPNYRSENYRFFFSGKPFFSIRKSHRTGPGREKKIEKIRLDELPARHRSHFGSSAHRGPLRPWFRALDNRARLAAPVWGGCSTGLARRPPLCLRHFGSQPC